jgi:predicted SAM-dependent methyltransferase
MDSLEDIKKRYPNIYVKDDLQFLQADVFNLPYGDNSIDEIRCDALIEHFSFKEESIFFHEVRRMLKPDGVFSFCVPDFEDCVKKWLNADDDWKDFFRDDEEAITNQHWFGNYSYSTKNRWGYLTASIFGTQNGQGQFHKNAYTENKIIAILNKLKFKDINIERFLWKGDRDVMLKVRALRK